MIQLRLDRPADSAMTRAAAKAFGETWIAEHRAVNGCGLRQVIVRYRGVDGRRRRTLATAASPNIAP